RARHTERVRLRVLHRLPPEPYHLLRAPYGAARKAPVAVDEDPYTGCQLLPVQRIEDVLVHDTPSLVRQADVRIRGASVLGCFDRPEGELPDAHVPDRGYRLGTPPEVRHQRPRHRDQRGRAHPGLEQITTADRHATSPIGHRVAPSITTTRPTCPVNVLRYV